MKVFSPISDVDHQSFLLTQTNLNERVIIFASKFSLKQMLFNQAEQFLMQ